MGRQPISLSSWVGLVSPLLVWSCALPLHPSRCAVNPAQQILDEINAVRVREGVRPLWPNILLAQAAQGHAESLAAGEASGHFGRDGSDPLRRITAQGYLPQAFGENTATGSSDPNLIVAAWLRSPAHREVMLDPSVQEIGLGGALALPQPVWVAVFGSQKDPSETRCHPWPIRGTAPAPDASGKTPAHG